MKKNYKEQAKKLLEGKTKKTFILGSRDTDRFIDEMATLADKLGFEGESKAYLENDPLIDKLRKDNKDINSKLDVLYSKSPMDKVRIKDLEDKIKRNREEIDKLISKSLK